MKNGGFGMWAFKFANTASGTYPRGIKSGHHFIWQGKRIVEDAYKNVASNKPVKTSSGESASFVTDTDKSDASSWISDSLSAEKYVEIDLGSPEELGSAVVYTGSSYGVYTSPDRIKNFKLQYYDDQSWKDIPGASEQNCRYSQVFSVFSKAVKTSKVRFVSSDKGVLKVREIKLFAKGDGPESTPDFNVSGIQRTGEVVRLFAKGFKDERDLLQTTTSVNDNGLDAYTSFDVRSGNYYMWLVQRGMFDYKLSLDLAGLDVAAGTLVVAETVNRDHYGEVTGINTLPANKIFDITLSPQSVVLLTIPARAPLVKTVLKPLADATVAGGKNKLQNYGSEKHLKVQLDASMPDDNKVSYMHFNLSSSQVASAKRILFAVNGRVDLGSNPFRLHVYGIPGAGFVQGKINWENAPLLNKREALVEAIGQKAFVAGEIAFDTKKRYHHLDVTEMLKKHVSTGVTFVLVRETRQLGDDADKGREVIINSKENLDQPVLELWSPDRPLRK